MATTIRKIVPQFVIIADEIQIMGNKLIALGIINVAFGDKVPIMIPVMGVALGFRVTPSDKATNHTIELTHINPNGTKDAHNLPIEVPPFNDHDMHVHCILLQNNIFNAFGEHIYTFTVEGVKLSWTI